MDTRLFDHIQSTLPEFNRDVTRGLATIAINGSYDGVHNYTEQYINRALRCAEADFPAGLKYIDFKRCTPSEEFAVLTARRGQSSTAKVKLELTHSDFYMVKYLFTYNDEEIKPVYLYLPYCREGGIIVINNSTFSISPVLADKSISVGEDSIYIPVSRAKLTLKRQMHPFYADNERISANVIWGKIHNGAAKKIKGVPNRRTIMADATLPHYLFCKYGFHDAFKHLAGIEVHAGYSDEINYDNYPPDEWVICKSMYRVLENARPSRLRARIYEPSQIEIAVRRKQFNQSIKSLIGGFYYVADRFSDRITPKTIDDIRVWRILMGHVIFASDDSEGKLLNQIDAHMESLDTYVDTNVRDLLQEDNVFVDDLYELFHHINETFTARIAESASQIASMYGKRLTILRYVLSDLTNAIFYVVFALRKAAKKEINKRVIQDIMRVFLKPGLALGINNQHVEVGSVSSPSDCMAFKITSNLILQTDIGSGNAPSKNVTIDSSKVLHSSILEVGQIANLPKTEPTGRKRVNPYVNLDSTWTVLRNPEFFEFLDQMQLAITR